MAALLKSDSNRAANTTVMPVQPLVNSSAPRRRASSGTMEEFVELEGTTTFSAPPALSYRYKLLLRNGLLRFWLEDCESKKQWQVNELSGLTACGDLTLTNLWPWHRCTSDLAIESYVDINNAVPGAIAADYVACFRTLLNRSVGDEDEIPRAFKRTKGDAFRLEISMKVHVLTSTRVATYSFDLEPISVERIDVLESRMRDLHEDMKVLRLEAAERTEVVDLQETVKRLQDVVKMLQETVKKAKGGTDMLSLLLGGEVQ